MILNMIGRLDQKNTLLVIVILCSTFASMLVMLVTFPKTIWVDVPNAGRFAISQMQTSLDDLQSFAHIHTEEMIDKLYKSQTSHPNTPHCITQPKFNAIEQHANDEKCKQRNPNRQK